MSAWKAKLRPSALIQGSWDQYVEGKTLTTVYELSMLAVSILNNVDIANGEEDCERLWHEVADKVTRAEETGLGWSMEDFSMWFYREFGASL